MFAMIDEAIIRDNSLSLRELRVLLALKLFANSKGEVWPKRKELSAITGYPTHRISAITTALVEKGFLEKIGTGGRSMACHYRLKTPNNSTKTVTESVTVTESETVTDLAETVTDLGTKTVTESVTGNRTDQGTDQEQTKNRPGDRARAHTRPTPAPDLFPVTATMRTWANGQGIHVNLDRETEKFLNHYRADGKQWRDWMAAWRNWMLKAQEFTERDARRERPPKQAPNEPPKLKPFPISERQREFLRKRNGTAS